MANLAVLTVLKLIKYQLIISLRRTRDLMCCMIMNNLYMLYVFYVKNLNYFGIKQNDKYLS